MNGTVFYHLVMCSSQLHKHTLFPCMFVSCHLYLSVCRGLSSLYQLLGAVRYLLMYIFTPARQATSKEATSVVELQYICMTTQLEHETDLIDIKANWIDHREQHWDEEGRSVHVVLHTALCVFVCVRGMLETEEGRQRQGGGGRVTMETISASAPGFPLD